ncbi:MAG: hypothetical protein ABI810_11220 [Sphingomonas bacterium]
MGNDEARAGVPGVHSEPALAPQVRNPLPVDDVEREAELGFEFVLPLDGHRRWGRDDDEIDPLSQQQFSRDEAGLDGLAQAHVVSDKKVHARKAERLSKWQQLISIQTDAGAKRRLQQLTVGSRGGLPT